MNAIVNFGTSLIIPLLGIYLLKFYSNKLASYLVFFTSFCILVFVPYSLGFVESIGEGYELNAFGGATSGLIGPFQNPHGASITLASALIVVLYLWLTNAINRTYLALLFVLGIYFLISTYVRTGFAMFIIGAIVMFIYYGKSSSKMFFNLVVFGTVIITLAGSWAIKNEVLMNRILGNNQYSTSSSIEDVGSGRGGIYLASIEIFADSNYYEKVFGIGQHAQVERIYKKTGMKIGSHNGFLDALLTTGILGLTLLVYYIVNIFIFYRNHDSPFDILILSLLVSIIVMTFVQGFGWLNANIFLMLIMGIKYQSMNGKLIRTIRDNKIS